MSASSDLMKNTEETVLINAISGPRSQDVPKVVEAVLRKPEAANAFSDPGVLRVYNDVIRGLFTPDEISRARPTLANLSKFQDFERLTLCVVRLLEHMDSVLDTLRTRHKEKQREVFTAFTKNIMNKIAQSLCDKFYYKTDLFNLIGDLFIELENLVQVQSSLRPNLEEQISRQTELGRQADYQKKMLNRKSIDCGINRLSELTHMGIYRLIPRQNGFGVVYFDPINFEENLRDGIKRALQLGGICQDKFIYFFLNDKLKYRDFDFFKIFLVEFDKETRIHLTSFCHFEGEPSELQKAEIFGADYLLEVHPASTLRIHTSFDNKIEVQYEDEVGLYNIQAKVLLAIFQIIFRQFHMERLPSTYYRTSPDTPAQVIITVEHLYALFAFIKSGGSNVDPRGNPLATRDIQSGMLGSTNRGMIANPTLTMTQPLDSTSKYQTHQSLLDVYGHPSVVANLPYQTANYGNKLGYSSASTAYDPSSRRSNLYQTPQIPQSSVGDPNSNQSKLQRILDSAQKKLDHATEDSVKRGLNHYIHSNPYKLLGNNTSEARNDAQKEEAERTRNEHIARLREEKAAKDEKEREFREARLREEEVKRREQEKALNEKMDRDRRDREEREKRDREDREKKEAEMREDRERRDRDRKDREERERQDREVKDKQYKEERARKEQEQKDREDRDRKEQEIRLIKDKEERDRRAKQREQEEREERERRENERKDKEERDRRDRDEKDKKDREDRERRDKEKKDKDERDRREREEREKADHDRKEKEDRERREKERAEKEKRDREDTERRENERKEAVAREDEQKEKRAREERERQMQDEQRRQRDNEERDRKEKERKDQEEADKKAREDRDRKDREDKERRNREEKERKDKLLKDQQDRDRAEQEILEKEKALKKALEEESPGKSDLKDEFLDDFDDFGDSVEKKKPAKNDPPLLETVPTGTKPIVQPAPAIGTKRQAPADEAFDFDDDDDDFKDVLDKPAPPNKGKIVEPAKPVTTNKPAAMKNAKADEELDFADDFDDIIDDSKGKKSDNLQKPAGATPVQQPTPKPTTPVATPVQPPRAAEVPKPVTPEPADPIATNFAGGLKGLKKKANEQKLEAENKEDLVDGFDKNLKLVEHDNPHGHERVMKSAYLPLVDQFLKAVSPLPEEVVNEYMAEIQIEIDSISMLMQEFVASNLFFLLDYQDTDQILSATLEIGKSKIPEDIPKQLGEMIRQILQGSFEDGSFQGIKYFLAPFNLVQDFGREMIVYAILDLKNKQVFMICLNPEITEAQFRSEKNVQTIANILAKSVNQAMLGNTNIEITADKIFMPKLSDGLMEFLLESCENPYLRYMMITYLIFYENATDKYNFEGFRQSIQIDGFDLDHATRFVSTMMNFRMSLTFRQKLATQPELAEGLMETVEAIMKEKGVQAIPKMAEATTPAAQLPGAIKADLEELKAANEGSEKVFSVLEYCPTEEDKLIYYICLQDAEPAIVMHLSSNKEPENSQGIEVIKTCLPDAKFYFEHARHQFASNNIDIFLYTWLVQVYEVGLSAIDALRVCIYNEAPFVSEFMNGQEMGEEEGQHEFDPEAAKPDSLDDDGLVGEAAADDDDFDDIDFGNEMNIKKPPIPQLGSKGGASLPSNLPSVKPGGAKILPNVAPPAKGKPKIPADEEFDDFDDDKADDGANFDDLDDLDF